MDVYGCVLRIFGFNLISELIVVIEVQYHNTFSTLAKSLWKSLGSLGS